jgi:hypothetical protein
MKIKSRYRFDICDLTLDEFIVIHNAVERCVEEGYTNEVSDTAVAKHLLDALDRRRMAGLPVEPEELVEKGEDDD